MTNDQKYLALLQELGELITAKNNDISIKRYQITELQAQLEKAEKEIERLKGVKNELAIT